MNDTTVIGAGRDEDVRAYVAAVRAWLADLPADEVEDLTAGMEADLAERAAESGGTLGQLLGEPESYAAELRAAAGLPPRAAGTASDAVPREPWTARLARESREVLTRHPWLRELRPTWWLVRGAALGWLAAQVLGTGRVLLLPALGAAVSLWAGLALRRREPLRHAASLGLAVANVVAAVVFLPMVTSYASGPSYDAVQEVGSPFLPQVTANGEPVQNIYAYDAAGNRLDGVRLFDQNGRALFVGLDRLQDGSWPDLPIRPDTGEPDVDADVFPVTWAGHDAWQDLGYGWTPPMTLPALPAAAVSTPTPSPTASPTS